MTKYLQIQLRLPGFSTALPRVYGSYRLEADSRKTLHQILDDVPRLLLDNCRWSDPGGLAALASVLHQQELKLERAWSTTTGGYRCVILHLSQRDLVLRPATEALSPLWQQCDVHVGYLRVGIDEADEVPLPPACL